MTEKHFWSLGHVGQKCLVISLMNEKQERILEAAEKLFARYGHRKTSIDEIAQQAGLGKGTIYLYFRSKDELYLAIVRRFGTALMQAMREAAASVEGPAEKLRQLLVTRLRFPEEHLAENMYTAESMRDFEESEHSALLAPLMREFRDIEVRMIEEIVRLGVTAGLFATGNARITAYAIYASLHSCGRPWPADEELKLEGKVDVLFELYLHGLMKRG